MLSEKHIKLIRADLTEAGLTMPDLLEELLDHLCTSIETEMMSGVDFQTAYDKACRVVIPNGAREIQTEVSYFLTYSKLSKMRKFLFIAASLWAFTSLIAMLFNILHWPGANILIQGSGLVLGSFLLPVFVIYVISLEKKRDWLEKGVIWVGGISSVIVSLGAVLKLFHLPGANIMLISSIAILAFAFVPLVFFRWYRAENQVMEKV